MNAPTLVAAALAQVAMALPAADLLISCCRRMALRLRHVAETDGLAELYGLAAVLVSR